VADPKTHGDLEPCDPTDLAPVFMALGLSQRGEPIPDDLEAQVDYIACAHVGMELVRAGADPEKVAGMYARPHRINLSYDPKTHGDLEPCDPTDPAPDGQLSMSVVFDD